MATTPVLRLDRSRPFGTVHGERTPDDPHVNVHFYQDSIPFDVKGLALSAKITDPKVKAIYERKLKRLSQQKDDPEAAGDEESVAESGDQEADDDFTPQDVNLEGWLRGDANYPWFKIAAALRDRYKTNMTKMIDAVRFLVLDEKVIPRDLVADKFKDFVK